MLTPERYRLNSSCGRYERDIWFVRSAALPHRLCIFLDAEHYLRDMNCLPVLEDLIGCQDIPPMSWLFVSHESREARHEDLICNNAYGRFIARDVVAWAQAQSTQLQKADNIICGLSLSGLAAGHIAFHYPDVFSRALCQSGSFWWLSDRSVVFPPARIKLWLSVGDQETGTHVSHPPSDLFQKESQIEGVESALRKFRALGATVQYNRHRGGHDIPSWREELAAALQWLMKT